MTQGLRASGRFVTLPPPLPGPSWPIVSWGNASLSPDGSVAPMSQGLGLRGGLTLLTRPFGHNLPRLLGRSICWAQTALLGGGCSSVAPRPALSSPGFGGSLAPPPPGSAWDRPRIPNPS